RLHRSIRPKRTTRTRRESCEFGRPPVEQGRNDGAPGRGRSGRRELTRGQHSASLLPQRLTNSEVLLGNAPRRAPGPERHGWASVDARLARLRAAWPLLSKHDIPAILALVGSAGVVGATRLQPSS